MLTHTVTHQKKTTATTKKKAGARIKQHLFWVYQSSKFPSRIVFTVLIPLMKCFFKIEIPTNEQKKEIINLLSSFFGLTKINKRTGLIIPCPNR
jgi:hypothetical protein